MPFRPFTIVVASVLCMLENAFGSWGAQNINARCILAALWRERAQRRPDNVLYAQVLAGGQARSTI